MEDKRMPSTSSDRENLSIIQVQRPHEMTPELRTQLIACWRDVTNNGGAVGFPFPPVTTEHVAAVAGQLITNLDPDQSRLLLATSNDTLLGWLSLSRQP